MAERRTLSLLECAIVASLALVPVMVGVVLLVAFVRPADPGTFGRPGSSDRYVSVRHVAALKTFERAIVERSAVAAGAVSGADVLRGVAGCRHEWQGDRGVLPVVHDFLFGATTEATPADRIAGQLGELDAALQRFSGRVDSRVGHPVGLDATRWFAAADAALDMPVSSPSAPGQTFRVRCADLAGALGALRRGDAAMLDSLAWRGTEGSTALSRWRPDQEMQVGARDVMRRNPWSGVAGCIYLGADDRGDTSGGGRDFVAGARSLQRQLCATAALSGAVAVAAAVPSAATARHAPSPLAGEPGLADAADDSRWQVPPSLQVLLQPLESLRQPTGELYRAYTGSDAPVDPLHRTPVGADRRNRVAIAGAPIDVGYSIDLTIDPAMQALAQKTAACYTGRHALCDALGMHRHEDGDGALGGKLLEGAMVRMAAIAVIDVASGRIEALAGALSPCARDEVDGPRRQAGCDTRLPFPARFRPDALLNPAVYHDAMPASTIKPILAAAFLADPQIGPRLLAAERAAMARDGVPARDSLRGQLMRSDSARFLDRMFCSERSFVACRRPWDVQQEARSFGWNAGCDNVGDACGKADLLFGRPLGSAPAGASRGPGPTPFAFGRLMSQPASARAGTAMHLMPVLALDADVLRRCAAGADGRRTSDDDWEKCRGGAVVDVVAEGWGQGHARASALGVAGMMATLAAAANGMAVVPRPHLVDGVRGVHGSDGAEADAAMRADARRWVAAPLPAPSHDAAEVILSGLSWSHRAGTSRSACEQVFDARRCATIDWLAGKTGTPSFPSDGLSLDAIARLCRDGAARPEATRKGVCSSLRPYKWYVAAFRSDRSGHGPWTKAIAVLTERNWLRASGKVHGAGDLGPNPSAEIAMQIVGRRTGFIEGTAP
ncbi:MAG: hypothetical protein ABI281_08885 [Caldimonas sp.]